MSDHEMERLACQLADAAPPAFSHGCLEEDAAKFIICLVRARHNISAEEFTGRTRPPKLTLPRQLAALLIRENTRLTTTQTAKLLCREHTIVTYSVKHVLDLAETETAFLKWLDEWRVFCREKLAENGFKDK